MTGPGTYPALTRGAAARSSLAHRRGRFLPDRIAEETIEERLAAAVPITSAAVCARNAIRQPPGRAAAIRLGARHRGVGLTMIALQGRKGLRVAAVDVLADLQVAGFVNKSSLIGDVHRDGRVESEIDLRVAVHALDLVLRVAASARQRQTGDDLGVLGRVLHPHTAMAVGALGVR